MYGLKCGYFLEKSWGRGTIISFSNFFIGERLDCLVPNYIQGIPLLQETTFRTTESSICLKLSLKRQFLEKSKIPENTNFCNFLLWKPIFSCQNCLKLFSLPRPIRLQSMFREFLLFVAESEILACNYCIFVIFCGVGVEKFAVTKISWVKPFDPSAFSKPYTFLYHLIPKARAWWYFRSNSKGIMKQIWFYQKWPKSGSGRVQKLEKSQSASEKFSWEHIFSSTGYVRLSENHSGIRKWGGGAWGLSQPIDYYYVHLISNKQTQKNHEISHIAFWLYICPGELIFCSLFRMFERKCTTVQVYETNYLFYPLFSFYWYAVHLHVTWLH